MKFKFGSISRIDAFCHVSGTIRTALRTDADHMVRPLDSLRRRFLRRRISNSLSGLPFATNPPWYSKSDAHWLTFLYIIDSCLISARKATLFVLPSKIRPYIDKSVWMRSWYFLKKCDVRLNFPKEWSEQFTPWPNYPKLVLVLYSANRPRAAAFHPKVTNDYP